MQGEGYLILATGHPSYTAMARNLAASLRVMDPGRRICLVHDDQAPPGSGDERLFDDTALLDRDPLYPGFMNKIRLYACSPYARAMFVDADCLLVKHDIDRYWDMARPHPFAITGGRRVAGDWKGADIARLIAQEGAGYLVQMNSGVFCFERSPAASQFFAGLNDYYLRRRHALGIGLHRGKPTQTDEIYIGLWMGLNGMDGCSARFGQESWMVSTWRAFGLKLDPARGIAQLRKPRRSTLGIPNPLGGWERLSPSIVHFIGLKPRASYDRASAYFHRALEHPEA